MAAIAAAFAGLALAGAGAAVASSQTPDSPDYAKATREGYLADIETLPLRKMIESAAKMGTKVTYKDPKTGKDVTADFTGYGDADQSRAQLKFTEESADAMAKMALGIQEKYGADFIAARLKELEQSDPVGTALRKKLGDTITADLDAGYGLPKGLEDQIVQSERSAQAARGNILGRSSAAAEAMKTGDAAFRLYQQRLANASSFLSGTTPVAQFGQISGAQQGAVAVQPMAMQQGMTLNQNAGMQSAAYAQQNYQNEVANNPWLNLAGQLSGAGTQMGANIGSAYAYKSILGGK